MSALLSLPLIWSQFVLPGVPERWRVVVLWMILFGEPAYTNPTLFGSIIFWLKVVSLFSLLGWILSWVTTALKERSSGGGSWLDIAALVAIVVGIASIAMKTMEATGRIARPLQVGNVSLVAVLAVVSGAIIFLWIEVALWQTIRRLGRAADLLVLVGMHLALIVGFGLGVVVQRHGGVGLTPVQGLELGARFGATYMGYVVFLRVLGLFLGELIAVRWRRLYSIASLSVIESNRRMWAPWVVLTVFLVVLAFTHWFLQPPRAAEMGRLFVGTLALLCSLLLTVMVTLLTPLSLPTDIQHQTIYTVVSKPVRRIELIWGRMLGFMTIVTVLVAIFGGISLLYLWRTVGGAIAETEERAAKEMMAGRTTQANHLYQEAAQMRVRMQAREPIGGSLTFIDSLGKPHLFGIDVGSDQSVRLRRSHIEGATPATAIWHFGRFPDPFDRRFMLDTRIPVDRLLKAYSIEYYLDRAENMKARIAMAEHRQSAEKLSPDEVRRLSAALALDREELENAKSAYDKLKEDADAKMSRAKAAEKLGQATQAEKLRAEAAELHSPPIPIEMTFNVYRTTKGRIGEPVMAEMEVTNISNPGRPPIVKIFPIREYYTNRQYIPAEILAGSQGDVTIQIRCLSPTQYLGMAESDLFILASAGKFGTNYMKALFGVWLQAMVLTAIGVFAGTFLSWPVALLTTIAFFVAGQVAFGFLVEFGQQTLVGGGPFESLIRLLTHDNQMSDLSPTLAVVTAKTLDSIVMPVMSRLVYVVPNFAALDVSNTVADGFEVRNAILGANLLLALAYALPFSIAGYFILKHREVAA